ncbi:MAG: type II toxin-antitoxin system death-on-curing family toxin [Cytophagales bacterium]|jgi:death-on-curing protein|nr:type II toxin-antitoxin system death-on-curing family toxin [Cytophagales bacterium]MCA6389707.1 type II toxin-antitoxin system death-on-curing family toxin [Cytophagales bacterium]MCA6393150.1 type II toxin-antitoxin system death-on-curing family toxin [Cytophagales bacterium]MCA6396962.1 type II toxin-antitoxin system death-on-curing family toxin [Cytophagales bacterium]MCA6399951.1 type II toxin-antitoxin system death-on-curing family toxin [Cytophagales bacterium]
MIEVSEVEKIHDILIDRFGGAKGIRDKGILESAIGRPFQTFDGKELYPDPIDKAAAIFDSIVSNHPFVDGNKRTPYVLLRLILKRNQLDIKVDQDVKYDFVIKAAKGELTFDKIRAWIRDNLE